MPVESQPTQAVALQSATALHSAKSAKSFAARPRVTSGIAITKPIAAPTLPTKYSEASRPSRPVARGISVRSARRRRTEVSRPQEFAALGAPATVERAGHLADHR